MDLERFIAASQRLLVITGAGCSTGSGIGDYRDEAGEWKRVTPVQHQDFMTKHRWRQRYWARSQLGYPAFAAAVPNQAHRTLARMEKQGRVSGLITQNVDRLHQRAGHRDVIDLHGRLDEVVCMQCDAIVERAHIQRWLEARNPQLAGAAFAPTADGDAELESTRYDNIATPQCTGCGGILKPNVVFFGDSVSRAIVARAMDWVDRADAVLVVGSSLMVYSGLRFVRRAHQQGIPVAAINRGKTRADELFTLKVEADCAAALAALVNA